MADVHQYYGIENLALTNPQRDTLVAALQSLGVDNGGLPHRRCHWRIRPDNQAVIFEALFDDTTLTIAAMKNRLAAIFNVSAGTISHSVATPTFAALPSPVVTFTRTGTDYLRAVAFGGVSATREQSRLEALAYLAANAEDWVE